MMCFLLVTVLVSIQMNEIENKLVIERKEIAAICARARNEYAKREIKKDFKAGLKVCIYS